MLKEKLGRVVRAGWNNFRRNSYVTFGTTGVIALVLVLFLGLIAVNFLSNVVVSGLEGKVDVAVYFNTDATQDDIMTVKSDLENLNTVAEVTYTSRDDALAAFKARHAQDALIQTSLSELQDNPLEASLEVKATDPGQYASIVSFLETHKLRTTIDKINYYENEAVIGRVQNISRSVQEGGLVATMVLAIIAILVAFNTIRLTIVNQRAEIEIMRLVGGSNWYIRAPFLVEGALYGIFAAVLSLAVWYVGVGVVSPKLAVVMPGVSLIGYFGGNSPQFVLLILVVGIGLGVVSSMVAIRRFLKV
ncbi:MAG TPA: permease-like cell division protein FtsX [Candidatus Paceibacterota bacterium]|nr:permease-like cell division protein FtsX [Candidatus Paceibacterota bacterium]